MIRNVRLNYTLKNGMLITSARITKGNKLVKVFITDLSNTARATLDIDDKRVLYCNAAIDFLQEDIDGLVAAIQSAIKPKTEPVAK